MRRTIVYAENGMFLSSFFFAGEETDSLSGKRIARLSSTERRGGLLVSGEKNVSSLSKERGGPCSIEMRECFSYR
jgi:hypothetical protein